MKITKTKIEGLVVIEPNIFEDGRGYFFESFNVQKFHEQIMQTKFVQDNESFSDRGVLRGLHYQLFPYAQSKLVRVIKGEVFDVAVDLRNGSSTFGQYEGVLLNEVNKKQFFIPRGFAHGFLVLSKEAIFSYKCDNYYAPDYERSILFDDPVLNIDWTIENKKIIISDKDKRGLPFHEADLFDYNIKLYD